MKSKFTIWPYLLLAGLLVVLVMLEYQNKPIDWSITLSRNSKDPFGAYIQYDLLSDLFPDRKIEIENDSPYKRSWRWKYRFKNHIIIDNSFNPDSLEIASLLETVSRGGNLFVSANEFNAEFLSHLEIGSELDYSLYQLMLNEKDSVYFQFTDDSLRNCIYDVKKNIGFSHFTKLDSSEFSVLAIDQNQKPIFLHCYWGEGNLFLLINTSVFTNYGYLHGKGGEFGFTALSYLPSLEVVWDTYYKPFGNQGDQLQLIKGSDALRLAYVTLLVCLVLFMVFRFKRNQRVIPVIEKPRNLSLDFVRTIGMVYFHNADNRDLFEKQLTYFLEPLRSKFHLSKKDFDNQHTERIRNKTGISDRDLKELFDYIGINIAQVEVSNKTLLKANAFIVDLRKKLKL